MEVTAHQSSLFIPLNAIEKYPKMAQECTPDVTSHAITAPGKYFSLTEVVYYQIYIHVCGAAVIQTINHEEVLLLNLSHS